MDLNIIERKDCRSLSFEELSNIMKSLGQPSFRAKQVYEWLWKKSATTFDEMSNLPLQLRQQLNDHLCINAIEQDQIQKSIDGTVKVRFRLHDGHFIESVLIPVPSDNRFTVCVSCQVGCSLSCTFCATGKMQRVRNLDPAEIYDQVAFVKKICQEMYSHPLTNIVYMGMGEPLLNYKNVFESTQMITKGLEMSARRITISTAGIAKMIKQLANEDVKFNLALSLHAADDIKRNEMMPINEQNNLAVLVDALKYYYDTTGNKITYEYIAFQNFNDTIEDATNLVKLCKRFPVKVNIIEYNQVEGVPYEKSSEDRINVFARYLSHHGVDVTVRRSRGRDIDAACGQLANKG
ncbi:MAG: 23S rRNA (adenine(2503)-C(2))-methyltransferase RlmN [Saprospiraceae bacterium]|nr:23S rRNA (adenine(2503)-C(2))-methyltransferase RlmN [Saprospiraceae bacterium]